MLILFLLSYFSDTTNLTLLVVLVLTSFSVFLILLRMLMSAASIVRMKESEKAVALQRMLQRDEAVCKKWSRGVFDKYVRNINEPRVAAYAYYVILL
ncbi:MAG TPA: hypothetical protein DEF06_04335 [Clostridiales bacterium]|nr:hypothetical protein [Clostridiales bacterium]